MSAQSLNPENIAALLAVLAGQQTGGAQQQQPGAAPGYPPAGMPQASGMPYSLPQPTSTGSVDLSSIRPVNTGSVSLQDAMNRARNFAAEKGLSNDPRSPRDNGHPYHHSRSRSRSPRRDTYGAYRDERRDDRRGYRGRSRSPNRDRYSPPGRSGGYARDRSPPRRDEDDEVISIDSGLVGLVIGRSGENLRRIEKQTGARIQFITPPDHKGPTRQCRISGSPHARRDAKREMDRIIEESRDAPNSRDPRGGGSNRTPLPAKPTPTIQPREGEETLQIRVPDKTVGLIIGRGGETIRDLQDRSGCHINIVGPEKSVAGLRPVNLIGKSEAAAHAQRLIMEIVDSDTRPAGGPIDSKQAPPRQSYQNDHQQRSDDGKIQEIMHVPSEAVGMIIGKQGDTIREMQATTGCKINVTQGKGDPPGADREIILNGTREALDAARAAINEKVELVREKNSKSRDHGGDRFNNYGQSATGGMPGAAPSTDANASGAADPYAMYGGYQNYLALWYAAMGQQGAGGAAPGQPGPPGS